MSHTPCSCRIEIPDLPEGRAYVLDTKYVKPDLFQIVYCPLHAAAPELLLAVKRALDLEKSNHGMTSHAYAYQQAIAAAEGR